MEFMGIAVGILALICALVLLFGRHGARRLLGCCALGGCTTSTGGLPAGPDTYTLTERASPILGGSDTA
jgi:hypothetical protein